MQGTAYYAISLPTRSCPRNAFDFSSMGTHPFQKNARAAQLLDLRAHGSLRAGAARKTKDARQLNWIYAESCHTSLSIIRIFSGFVKALF